MLNKVDEKWYQGDYITFEDAGFVSVGAATHKFLVANRTSGVVIGVVKWYNQWRKYCFFPVDAIFEQNCLRDIADFVELMTVEHKHKKWKRYNPPLHPRIVSVTKQALEEKERKKKHE